MSFTLSNFFSPIANEDQYTRWQMSHPPPLCPSRNKKTGKSVACPPSQPLRKYNGQCVEKRLTQATCVTAETSKIENKTRGKGSGIAPHSKGPTCRV